MLEISLKMLQENLDYYSKLPKKCTSIKVTNRDMPNDSLQFMSATNFCCKRKWTI